MEKIDKGYPNPALMIGILEKVSEKRAENTDTVKEGYYIYYETWCDKYRNKDQYDIEECLTIILGKKKSGRIPEFYEAICYGSYWGGIRYYPEGYKITPLSPGYSTRLIPIEKDLYKEVKRMVEPEDNRYFIFSPEKISGFIRTITDYVRMKYPKAMEEEKTTAEPHLMEENLSRSSETDDESYIRMLDSEPERVFERPDFYLPVVDLLEKCCTADTSEPAPGSYAVYFDVWCDEYKCREGTAVEECCEIIVGKLINITPPTFDGAVILNTYHGSVIYTDSRVTVSAPSAVVRGKIMGIDEDLFKELVKITGKKETPQYSPEIITGFVARLYKYLIGFIERRKGKTVDKKREIPEEIRRGFEKAFERGDFYMPLISSLISFDGKNGKEVPNNGDICIYYDIWKDEYRIGNTRVFEDCVEVAVGSISKRSPLTFSEAFILNSYQGNLRYSRGYPIVKGGKAADRRVFKVDKNLFNKLRMLLKPDHWKSDVSYRKSDIIRFVMTVENYLEGKYPGKNFAIIRKKVLLKDGDRPKVVDITVKAPEIAEMAAPGQFIVLRLDARGERIPLTIADADAESGTIRLIFQAIGKTTTDLAMLEEGDYILDLLGPLGTPIEIKKYDKPVLCVAGGMGAASILMKIKALKKAGNKVITILGAKNTESLVLADEISKLSDEFYPTTDDGSLRIWKDGECFYRSVADGSKIYGGFVNYLLEAMFGRRKLLERDNRRRDEEGLPPFIEYGPSGLVGKYKPDDFAEIIAVGPLPMMWAVVNVVAGNGRYAPHLHFGERGSTIKVMVSLNPIMVDGTGMCGGCRVSIYNPELGKYETKFACVDGPVFNGMLVDFDSLIKRARQYFGKEQEAMKVLEIVGW